MWPTINEGCPPALVEVWEGISRDLMRIPIGIPAFKVWVESTEEVFGLYGHLLVMLAR